MSVPRRKLWLSKKDMERKRWAEEQVDIAMSHIMRSVSSLADADEQTKYNTDLMVGRMAALADITGQRQHRKDLVDVHRWYQQAGVEPDQFAVSDGMHRMADEWNERWRDQS
jgi:hypothetical protein